MKIYARRQDVIFWVGACVAFFFCLIRSDSLASPTPTTTLLEQRASLYVNFRKDIEALDDQAFDSAATTRTAHHTLASHDPAMLSSGWVAYAALVAADTPAFVQSIKKRARWRRGAKDLIAELRRNPSAVRELEGADVAIDAVLHMIAKDAIRIRAIGEGTIQQAYDMQAAPWAKQKFQQDGPTRVRDAEDFAALRLMTLPSPILPVFVSKGIRMPSLHTTPPQWSADWSNASIIPNANPHATPIMDRALILAARYVVGDLNQAVINSYAGSTNTKRCLATAQLNFAQCISATRSAYEEAFCIGTHGLKEVSDCVGWVAGVKGE